MTNKNNKVFLYQNQELGLRFLTLEELGGPYPNWFLDREVCEHNSHGTFPMSQISCEAYVKSLDGSKNNIVFAVYHLGDDLHIGNVSLQAINWLNRNAEIAFIFGEKNYWGRGYAFQAAQLALHHAFTVLNLHRIHCGTASTNLGMQKLAAKLGMQEEGKRRQSLFLNGEYVDILEYGILRDEFISQQN